MGRESTITYEQVATVADALRSAGINPTMRAVRERMGNTGSMGTINKMLQDWKAEQRRPDALPLAIPPGVQRAWLEYMGQELSAARAAQDAEIASLQESVNDLATDNERMTADIEEKQRAMGLGELAVAGLEGMTARLKQELETANLSASVERTAAEAARVELAKSLLRLEAMPRLESDLATLRDELDQERRRTISAEQLAAVAAARIETMASNTAKLENELAETVVMLNNARTIYGAEMKEAAAATERLKLLPIAERELTEALAELNQERERRAAAEQAAAVNLSKLEAAQQVKPVRHGSIRLARRPR